MAFRYINPGYGALTGDSSVETFENATYNPTNGVAFQKCRDSNNYYYEVKIPTSQAFTSDIYGKFNLYFDSNSSDGHNFFIGAISSYNTSNIINKGVGVRLVYSKMYLQDGYVQRGSGINLQNYALNSIWFHWHKDANFDSSYGELNVNGNAENVAYSSYGYNYDFSSDNCFYIIFSNANYLADKIFISELIISDKYISPKEQVIALPISETVTDMAAGDSGIYIADAANQSLLQSVDVSSLIENYGASSAITGIGLVGNPAYKTAEGLAKLTALSKSGGSIAEHNTIALSGDSTAMIIDCWGLSSVTIADLQNMQFGWKVGE